MPASSDRKTATRSSSRGRESGQSARRRSNTRSTSQRSAERKTGNGSRAKAGNGSRAKAGNGSRAKAANAKAANGSGAKSANGSQAQTNHQSESDHFGREALTAAIGATVGIAGGVLLGRTALARERKVLGVPMPKKIDLAGVGQQLGEAGRQFGKLASEVRTVREKAEQIGKVLT
jgi:hypothetical protein